MKLGNVESRLAKNAYEVDEGNAHIEVNQEIARVLLEKKGIYVEIAENGQEGQQAFEASPIGYYDAILMDIRMPIMNGYEAARGIRSLHREDAGRVPILAMTADAFLDDQKKCFAAGMNGHLSKPIDAEKLYEALAAAIAAARRQCPADY